MVLRISNKIIFAIMPVLAILLFAEEAFAMNIGYSTQDIDFVPNEVITLEYTAMNTLDEAMGVSILLVGDLIQYIKAEPQTFELGPRGVKNFKITVSFPDAIEKPGSHRQVVMVKEERYNKHAGINVYAAPGVPLFIHVPFEGKYLDAVLQAEDAKINEPVLFTVGLTNLGSQTINSVSGDIDVYSSDKTLVTNVMTDSLSAFEPTFAGTLSAKMETMGFKAGKYTAKANLRYDEFSKSTEEVAFRIGELKINIVNNTKEAYIEKGFNEFEVWIESAWNDPVEDVYAEVKLAGNRASFKTLADTVGAWEIKTLTGYLDATSIPVGNYTIEISLNYAGKSEKKEGILEIKSKPAGKEAEKEKETVKSGIKISTTAMIALAILALIALNIIFWIIISKRNRQKKD
ncbi:MAG: hypothetical protein NTV63_03850 [Candidatus Woesearchaeota archaeon]|nr:hypothetical protein [Candidatus Woesearchaeota archaeon]